MPSQKLIQKEATLEALTQGKYFLSHLFFSHSRGTCLSHHQLSLLASPPPPPLQILPTLHY